MKASKTLTASLAAAAMVGSIGLAYAQTTSTDPATPGGTTGATTQMENNTGTSAPDTTLNNTQTPASSDLDAAQERDAQADRN